MFDPGLFYVGLILVFPLAGGLIALVYHLSGLMRLDRLLRNKSSVHIARTGITIVIFSVVITTLGIYAAEALFMNVLAFLSGATMSFYSGDYSMKLISFRSVNISPIFTFSNTLLLHLTMVFVFICVVFVNERINTNRV